MKKLVLRVTFPLICFIGLTSVPRAEAQAPAPSGPQAAAIFAILIGVPVGVGYGIYYATHAPHKIQGCVTEQGGAFVLTDANGKQYFLAGNTAAVKSGERMRLSGKSRKDHLKRRAFQVKRVSEDYGVCSAGPALP